MEDGWLQIVNLKKIVNFSRRLIYHNFDEKNKELEDKDFLEKISKIKNDDDPEMDDILPFNECENIFKEFLKKKINKKTKEVRMFIKESDYDEVLMQLNRRMVSNIIQNLVKKGYLETAFDSEINDFVFWKKEK